MNDENKKRIALVTGATGFIGSTLVRRLLEDGCQVHALVRQSSDTDVFKTLTGNCQLQVHDGSTEQLIDIFNDVKPGIVFHLASSFLAEHRPEEVEGLICSNVLFSTQLVEAMSHTGCDRLINTGTSWQHYNKHSYFPVNLYAATKQAFEDILLFYHDAQDLSVITLKLFDTYGLEDKRRKLMNILIDTAVSGQEIDMSPGEQLVDLTHVDDVVQSFLIAAKLCEESPTPINRNYLISGERYTVKELIDLVQDAFGCKLRVRFGGRPYRKREVMVPIIPHQNQILDGWSREIFLRDYLFSIAGT